jgi:hypothetical protein
MSIQHAELATGRWHAFPLVEQMAHIGSEVERALNWKQKGNADYSIRAYERALELLDFTLDDPRHVNGVKEIARVRECLVDFFQGTNEYGSTDPSWRKYFGAFTYAARRKY